MTEPIAPQDGRRWLELKTDPHVFDLSAAGIRRYEIRFNDRDYKVGDGLCLRRTESTGAEMRAGAPLVYSDAPPLWRTVTHVLDGYGLQPGWVILSLREYVMPGVLNPRSAWPFPTHA